MRSITGCTPTAQQATERIRSNEREASGESVCVSECVREGAYACACLPAGRPARLPICLAVGVSVRASLCRCVSLSFCLPARLSPLSLCVSLHRSVGVFVQCQCVCRCVHLSACLLCIFACGRSRVCRARVCVDLARQRLGPSRFHTRLTPATSTPRLNGRTLCRMRTCPRERVFQQAPHLREDHAIRPRIRGEAARFCVVGPG